MGQARVASVEELRRICQGSVRDRNDLAGAIYGSRISIYITSLFLRLGLTANFASRLMLLSGLAGSLGLLLPGWGRLCGLILVAAAFVLDCVDGEIARYHGIDSYRWAAFDYIHHITVKGLSFPSLGVGLYLEFGTPWTMAAGGFVTVCWLALLAVKDLGAALFTKKIVLDDRRSQNPAYQRLLENLERLPGESPAEEPPDLDVWGKDFRFGPWVIRAFLVSFDLAILLFLATAVLDALVPPLRAAGIPLPCSALLIYAYVVILPLHIGDVLLTAMVRGGLRNELYDLARRVERFRNP